MKMDIGPRNCVGSVYHANVSMVVRACDWADTIDPHVRRTTRMDIIIIEQVGLKGVFLITKDSFVSLLPDD